MPTAAVFHRRLDSVYARICTRTVLSDLDPRVKLMYTDQDLSYNRQRAIIYFLKYDSLVEKRIVLQRKTPAKVKRNASQSRKTSTS